VCGGFGAGVEANLLQNEDTAFRGEDGPCVMIGGVEMCVDPGKGTAVGRRGEKSSLLHVKLEPKRTGRQLVR